ncbi:Calcium-binding protein NCS-1 [Dimargaris cristalligena]|uniref:Calcium-binding protein NCS-1 n=1 Tax=Dimargaris cristalligena TaxID=215637 RepID=A0A4P9ZNH1_9FUNG|nr:Calcium-binding protein NCS-1 [Dimargaris cristalligena]RKP34833.1 calcium-binding protein NCS-1 [Dimargaris cristalligena]|eukprot:RKP34833.1 calcium-binding protein NCS-1 [Dimargaris cristalligena]
MGKTNSKLSHEELRDLREMTYFEKSELKQWYKGFIKDFPNGTLGPNEFRKIYKQFFPFGDSSEFADYVFRVFDRNNNNQIDFKEFICALSISCRGNLQEKLQWTFNLYDIDRDGYITYEEMLQIVEAIYKMVGTMVNLPEDEDTPEKRVKKLFNMIDTDRDGKVSLTEFQQGAEKDPSIVEALNLYAGLV